LTVVLIDLYQLILFHHLHDHCHKLFLFQTYLLVEEN
jgi:hypothetical protein